MPVSAAIYGCLGLELNLWEKQFFQETQPWGLILFRRNIADRDQLKRLCESFKESVGREAPIFIDQEGGRVARMRSPDWRDWSPPLDIVHAEGLTQREIAELLYLRYRWIGAELRDVGITVNCAPLLDILTDETHQVIGDRALGHTAEDVSRLAGSVYQGLRGAGIQPVIKHLPGHGRAKVDSHLALPIIDTDFETLDMVDFQPFKHWRHAPIGMTAHIVYTALDPESPATQSAYIIQEIIRKHIGFQGLLLTDDLSMEALNGEMHERARKSLKAGCDICLHCNGDPDEMQQIAGICPSIEGKVEQRILALQKQAEYTPPPFDKDATEAILNALIAKTDLPYA